MHLLAARPPAINNAPMHGVASGPISAAAAGETQTPPPPFLNIVKLPLSAETSSAAGVSWRAALSHFHLVYC